MAAQDHDKDTRPLGLRQNRNDPLHDQQLLRDVEAINEQTVRALGLLPVGGLPVQVKRRPNLPKRLPPLPVEIPAATHTPATSLPTE